MPVLWAVSGHISSHAGLRRGPQLLGIATCCGDILEEVGWGRMSVLVIALLEGGRPSPWVLITLSPPTPKRDLISLAQQGSSHFTFTVKTVSYTHLTLPTILLVQISVVAVSLKKKKTQKSTKKSQCHKQQKKDKDSHVATK
eukprot:TRINITY_DN5733_c0_g1_i14.p1 TRINITY_DN5733_c0_g1~~TRINITY_DN5733_c0_g1_i14.p1  ORF type:complete len:142 (+),score=17.12 TRINITY_DN5733_c0_g1_i14:195-620(+)